MGTGAVKGGVDMKHKGLSVIFACAFGVSLLWTAAAGAEPQQAGLHYFSKDFGSVVTANDDGTPLLSEAYADFDVTVTEVRWSGATLQVGATVSLKPGVPGVLRDAIFESGGAQTPEETKDGVPLYYVESHIVSSASTPDNVGAVANEDGSLSFFCGLQVQDHREAVDLWCMVRYVKAEPGEDPAENSVAQTYLPFRLKTPPVTAARKLTEPVAIPDAGVVIDEALLIDRQDDQYVRLCYRLDGGETIRYNPLAHVFFVCADESMRTPFEPFGAGWGWLGKDNYYTMTMPLADGALPDTLDIMVMLDNLTAMPGGQKTVGRATLTFEDCPGDVALPAPYAPEARPCRDDRGIVFPWAESADSYAYVTGDKAVDMYRYPDDPGSPMMRVNPGTAVSLLGYYNEWAYVYLVDFTQFPVPFGYVKRASLADFKSGGEEGIPIAVLAGLTPPVDGRAAPSAQATVISRFDRLETALIIGETDEWYYAVKQGKYGYHMLGYVPKQSVALTGEQVRMLPIGQDEWGTPYFWSRFGPDGVETEPGGNG